MEKTLRIRNRAMNVELTFWKLLPIMVLLLLLVLSQNLAGAPPSGPLPPPYE